MTIPAGAAPRRADRVAADLSGLSRSHVQRLISEGRLTADGRPIKANAIVPAGAILELALPPPVEPGIEPRPDIEVSVVYEDDDLLIVDKPSGLVVHPAPGHASGTLVNALVGRGEPLSAAGIAGVRRPGIVHRLDRDTSGLLMVARTDAAQAALQGQLKARRIKKTYLALVAGAVAAGAGRIEAPIGRDPGHRTRMAIVAGGRPATTNYRVRERFDGWTLLELDLVTGRTHQLRVHLAGIGHPVAGDPVYGTGPARRGPDGLERLFLHAWRLDLTGPTSGRLIRAEAPLPPELAGVLEALRGAGRPASGAGRAAPPRPLA